MWPRARVPARSLALLAAAAIALLGLLLTSGGAARARHPAAVAARDRARRAGARGGRTSSSPYAQQLLAERRVLAYTGYIQIGTGRRREVALTFDDGPGQYTLGILAILQRYHVAATFFEIGRQVRAYPDITRRLVRAGMTIGDHTEDHPPLGLLAASQQALQIDRAAAAIGATGAPAPLLFRPPYGSFDQTTMALLRARRMLMVLWTVDTSDYARPGVTRIVAVALSGARPGAIILLHDGGGDRSQTLAALPRIVTGLRRRGYRLVSLAQLLLDDPPPASQPAPGGVAAD